MRLVYKPEQNAVQIGDVATIDGQPHTVIHFRPPTSPASEGKVTVRPLRGGHSRELYVSVIGAEWIEREDRNPQPVSVTLNPAAPSIPNCPFIVGRRYRTRDGLCEGTFAGLDPNDRSIIVLFENVTGPAAHEIMDYGRHHNMTYPTYPDGHVYRRSDITDSTDFLPTPVDAEPELRQSPAEPTWSMDPPPAPGVYQVRINPTGRDFFSRWNGSYWGLTCGTAAQARTEYQDTRGDDCNSDRFRGWAPLTTTVNDR